ncbi:MAG: beta-ketoacyl-[acyl-carrier-protein] synthase family protein [Thermodesulfobacteriota bacterium]
MRSSSVAITGLGCLCAPGNNLGECMFSLFKGDREPAPPLRFTSNHSGSYPVFEVPDDLASLDPKGISDISRTARLALAAAHEAVGDAGLDGEWLRSKRVGICMGTTVGSAMNNEAFYRQYCRDEEPDMAPITRFLYSNPASVLAREFDLTGPCQTVVNACSSGTDAVGLGALWIQAGLCDIVLAGGADELCHVTYNGFISLMITDDSPCKPFDQDRKGLNLGEGAAILILESEECRRNRKKQARAFVLGYGASCDAYHLTAPHPQGKGLRRAIEEAMELSGTVASDLAFINAHGTGTKDNDRIESQVLHDLLPGIPFLSTKGYTGHTLGAAGAIETAFTVACLEEGRVPKNAGFTNPDPDLSASPAKSGMAVKGTVALSESLAFGGHNAVLAIGIERGLS